MKSIYDMKLHEALETILIGYIQVPGGWIYRDKDMGYSVFVPLNIEFE